MGKASCKVVFKSFRWSRGGYADVMASGGVQALVRQHAAQTQAAANAMFEPRAGEGEGYVLKPSAGRLAKGYIVATHGPHAANHNARYNTLLKALR